MSVHNELDAIFLEHQRALLRLDHASALKRLEGYEALLMRHMKDEEEVLIPVYSGRCEFPAVAAPKLYLDEHKKMLSHLDVLKNATAALNNAVDIEADVLRILGHEAFYLRLSAHHDRREAEHLYPLLDETLTKDEKAAVMSRVHRRDEALKAANT